MALYRMGRRQARFGTLRQDVRPEGSEQSGGKSEGGEGAGLASSAASEWLASGSSDVGRRYGWRQGDDTAAIQQPRFPRPNPSVCAMLGTFASLKVSVRPFSRRVFWRYNSSSYSQL